MPDTSPFENLSPDEKLDRLHSYEAIRQLVAKYSHLLDSKDLQGVSELFVPDVKASPTQTGREALTQNFEEMMKPIGVTILKVTTHLIEFQNLDNADGKVYVHGDIQIGGRWIHQAIRYSDKYQRRDGEWLFVGRKHQLWYGADVGRNPLGYPPANWPNHNIGQGDLM